MSRATVHTLEQRTLLSGATDVTFGSPRTYAFPDAGARGVVEGVLPNGHIGLAAVDDANDTLSVLPGNGDGTFDAAQTYAVGNNPYDLLLDDLGNGLPDIVVSNFNSNTLSVLLGRPNGTFSAATTYAVGNEQNPFTEGDLGNGHVDLVVPNAGDNTISVLLGNGDGTFQPQQTYALNTPPGGVSLANLGDGHLDAVVEGEGEFDVLPGNGDGTFGPAQTYSAGDSLVASLFSQFYVVDLGNGDPDIIYADADTPGLSVLMNNGNGTFQPPQKITTLDATGFQPDDLGTGHPDLIVDTADGFDVLTGNGNGTFQATFAYTSPAGQTFNDAQIATFVAGRTDLVAFSASTTNNNLNATLLFNNGDGTFTTGQTEIIPGGGDPVSTFPLDVGDGRFSIYTVDVNDSLVTVLPNTTPFTPQLSFAATPASTAAGDPLSPVAVNVDGIDGSVLSTNTSNVTLTISAGGTLLGTRTVAAVGGVATFSGLSIPTIGTYTLQATDSAATAATSPAFNVAPDTLVFTTPPQDVTADQPLSGVSVAAVDPTTGAVVTTDTSLVTLSISNGGVLLGTTTVAAVAGVATFSDLLIPGSGTYTLTATDAIDSAGASPLFVVTPPALTFAVEPVVVAYVGQTLGTVVVEAIDPATGALLVDDDSAVTLSLSGESGTLTGETTAVAAGGIATFTGLDVSAAGGYRLLASYGLSASAGGAISNAFTVVAPTAGAPDRVIGKPDPTFGIGGTAAYAIGFTATTAVAADGSGSVLVGPFGTTAGEAFGLTRYTATGSLDTSFGTAGVTATAFTGMDAVPTAVAVLTSGSILVAGTVAAADGSSGRFAVARYTPTGDLDPSFGTDGLAYVGNGVTGTVLKAMAIGADGTIYLAGGANGAFAVAALTAAGLADDGFGGGGIVPIGFAAGTAQANALAVEPNGSLVVAGSVETSRATEAAVARLLSTGALDPKFGTKGQLTTPAPVGVTYQAGTAVTVDAAGRVVVGGLSADGSGDGVTSDFLLRRYTAAGRLDKTFGYDGTVLTSFGEPTAVTGLVPSVDGSIVASGRAVASLAGSLGPQDLVVARFTTAGNLDPTFAGTGATSVNLGGGGLGATATTESAATLRPATVRVARTTSRTATMFEAVAAAAASLTTAFNQFVASAQGAVAATATGEILATGQAGDQSAEVELVAAGVDLAVAVTSLRPTSVAAGGRGTTVITITEAGTATAAGSVTVDLAFSPAVDGSTPGAPAVKVERINLRASQSRAYRMTITCPGEAGTWYVVATVTGRGGVLSTDLDPANNTAVSETAVSVLPAGANVKGKRAAS